MIEKVIERFGRIDVLMNNAGVVWEEPTGSIPIRLFEQELGVNVLGPFYAIRAALPKMLEMGAGNIINVSGGGPSDISHLAATKRAVEVLTVGLAPELRTKGIAVNCLKPVGWVDTPGALLRNADPQEIAPPNSYMEAAVLLASQTAESCTGNVCTDAEVLRDLGDRRVLNRFVAFNPPAWGESLRGPK